MLGLDIRCHSDLQPTSLTLSFRFATDLPSRLQTGMTASARHDVARRWLSVFAGTALMISVGSNHSISAWNAHLKSTLDYSQAEISLVCSMASFGAYFSVTPGYVFDRVGAHRSILVGGGLLALAYLSISYGVLNAPRSMHPILVGLVFVVVGQASNFGVFASLGPNEGLFGDENRGKIMALQFAAFSGGGALFAMVYKSWFDNQVAAFFEFMAIMFLVVFHFAWAATYRPSSTSESQHEMKAMDEFVPDLPEDHGVSSLSRLHAAGLSVDITGRTLLKDTRFWLLFTTVFILVGASLFIMANIAFIVESLNGEKAQVSTMVALFSIGNCVGRVVAGALSDLVFSWCPRIYFVSMASLFVAFNHVLLLVIPPSLLIIPIGLTGIADGIMFAVFPVLTRETFGLKHFGKNFGMMSIANALGFPLFYSPIGSYFYQVSSHPIDGVDKCIGPQCFQPVFILVVCLSVVAFAASLKFATRQRYMPLP